MPFTPSTNNNLESTNRYIKDKNTLRNRLSLQEFLKTAFKLFFKEPIKDLKLQTSAYQWIKADKIILTYESTEKDHTDYFIPAKDNKKIVKEDVKNY